MLICGRGVGRTGRRADISPWMLLMAEQLKAVINKSVEPVDAGTKMRSPMVWHEA